MDTQILNFLDQYYKILMAGVVPVFYYSVPIKALSNYKLSKHYNNNLNIINISSNKEIPVCNNKIQKIYSKQLKKYVLQFSDFMLKKYPQNFLTNFKNNINSVNIRNNNIFILALFGWSGFYLPEKNEIYSFKNSIFHELFHMSSSYYDKKNNIIFCGFSQSDSKNNNIGNGINEGYTQLLTNRYFGGENKTSCSYKNFVYIAYKLEEIVGKNKTEENYFNADLPGLINELSKYTSIDNIKRFIYDVDFMYKHRKDIFSFRNKTMHECIKNIYVFLINTYIEKLNKQLLSKEIKSDEFIKQSCDFILSFKKVVKYNKINYKVLTENDINEKIEKVKTMYNSYNNELGK